MSEYKLPKTLEDDIELISKLEYVEIERLDDSIFENDYEYEDDSNVIQFEDSSQGSDTQTHRFEVRIRLKDSIYAISKKRDCVVTLRIELDNNLKYPLIEISGLTNSSVKLKNKCQHYLDNVAFGGSSATSYSIYKLIIDFKSFLQYESRNADLHPISDTSSIFDDYITLSISSMNEGGSTPCFDRYITGNPYNGKKIEGREGFMDKTRHYILNKKDKMYVHLSSHSRYFREFREEAVLGAGSFGCVTKVLRNGINYAVKQIPIYENYESILHEEAAVLASLQHPNIVRYFDAWLEQSPEYLMRKFKSQQNHSGLNNNCDHNTEGNVYSDVNSEYNLDANVYSNSEDNHSAKFDEVDFDASDMEDFTDDNKVYTFYNRFYYGNGVREVNDISVNDSNKDSSIFKDKEQFKNQKKHYKNHKSKMKKHGMPKKCLFILMEYCGENSLFDTINKHPIHETPQQVIELFRQLMEALSYIHEKGIIHRDVKPSNIFLKFENEFLIKLGDFGLTAKSQQSKDNKTVTNENGLVGTLHYMAPEQLECDGYNEKVDIYSAGVVLFEMLSRPFQTYMERCEILSSFSTNDKQWPEGFRDKVDNRLFKLLESMLNINPNKRPSASEILQNEIFTSNKFDLKSLYSVITQYPHSMESVQLLNTIFTRKQQYKKLSDYYNMVTSNNVINYVNLELGLIYDKEFKLRNVQKIHLSLLTHLPDSLMDHSHECCNGSGTFEKVFDKSTERSFERSTEKDKDKNNGIDRNKLLLNNGRCCYLRHSLLYSLSECIPNEFTTIMRRYSYLPVYSTSMGRNDSKFEGKLDGRVDRFEGRNMNYYLAYDIIVDYLILLNESNDDEMYLDSFFTYELITVASRPLKRFINCSLVLEWNHSELLTKLIEVIVPNSKNPNLERLLLSETQIKGKVAGVPDECVSILSSLHSLLRNFKGRVSEFRKSLENLPNFTISPELESYFKNLQFFEKFLGDFEGICQFSPMCNGYCGGWVSEGCVNGKGGIFEKFYFRIFLEIGKRNFGDFIFGGCYNPIIESNINRRNAFGFEMNLQPIYDYFTQNMVNKNLYNNLNLNYSPEVVVYTSQINLIIVTTSLETKFWNVGVKCYKKIGGQLNIKRIVRLKKAGLFSLQKLRYLITIKGTIENNEVQYIISDINLDSKQTFGAEDSVLEYILHNINPN